MRVVVGTITTTGLQQQQQHLFLGQIPCHRVFLGDSSASLSPFPPKCQPQHLYHPGVSLKRHNNRVFKAASSSSSSSPSWWCQDTETPQPSLSDAIWPALGAFGTMAMFGKMDEILVSRGSIPLTMAPLAAVSAVLFITPHSPPARKYNMFMAQIGCAAIGVAALRLVGPGWLARSLALSASLAFMVFTKCNHPPAASLPLLFIDGAKFHHLNFWYALFPGAVGCILIALIQEIVCYLKENIKF